MSDRGAQRENESALGGMAGATYWVAIGRLIAATTCRAWRDRTEASPISRLARSRLG